MSRRIRTIPELIAHFGGPGTLAKVLGTYVQMVVNWRGAGHIPAIHYKRHIRLLKQAGLEVSDTLWGFEEKQTFRVRRRQEKAEAIAGREAAE